MTKIANQNKPVFSLSEQAQCLRREIQMRWAVYPGRVANQKMTQDQMDREIDLMDAAADNIERMAKNGQFRASYDVMTSARSLSSQEVVKLLLEAQENANRYAEAGEFDKAYNESIKLNGAVMRLTEILGELKQQIAPVATPNPTPALPAPLPTPQMAIPAAVAQKELGAELSSPEQRARILTLLNHPAVDRSEKTKQLLNINRRTPSQADAIIARLNALIEDAEGPVEYKQAS